MNSSNNYVVEDKSLDKFYHCYLFLINLNDTKALDDLILITYPKVYEYTSKVTFDYVMLLVANKTINKSSVEKVITKIINLKANAFARQNGLFYIDMDFNKQSDDIINKVLKVRLSQSFGQYTEYYIKDIRQQLSKVILKLIRYLKMKAWIETLLRR